MIRRLRARIGVYASAIILTVGLAMVAKATDPITRSQAESMIDTRLAAAGVLVFGAFWVLLLTISGRSEKALTGSLMRLEAAVQTFTKALADHDGSPFAHRAASGHNHGPMVASIERVEATLDKIETHIAGLLAGQTLATAELDEQDVRLGHVEKSIAQLLTEHCLLHGQMLRHRETDAPGLDPLEMRGPK